MCIYGQDVIQGQFLRVIWVLIQNFPFPFFMIAQLKLENLVYPTIYP